MRSEKTRLNTVPAALLVVQRPERHEGRRSGSQRGAVIVDHESIALADIPSNWIDQAKQTLHIAYGHTSHGSQLTTGMTGLVAFRGRSIRTIAAGPAGLSTCATSTATSAGSAC